MQGLEVGKAASEVKLKEGTFPAGSFVVKRDQPYARLAKILLEKQVFPDPNLRTYDDTGWTMGLMMQTKIVEIADKAILDVPVSGTDTTTDFQLMGMSRNQLGAAAVVVPNYGSNRMMELR